MRREEIILSSLAMKVNRKPIWKSTKCTGCSEELSRKRVENKRLIRSISLLEKTTMDGIMNTGEGPQAQ